MVPGQNISVTGDATLLPGALTVITAGSSPVVVTGTFTIDGSLTIEISDSIADGQKIPIILGTVNGSFADITVRTLRACATATGTPLLDAAGFSVIVSVDKSACKGSKNSLSTAAIAGIVIGVVVVFAILIVLALLLYRKFVPNSTLFRRTAKARTRRALGVYDY